MVFLLCEVNNLWDVLKVNFEVFDQTFLKKSAAWLHFFLISSFSAQTFV